MGGAERVTLPIDDSWNASAAGRVVHVAGALTDEVFSFLGPAIDALARSGVDQSVVIIDEPRWRHRVASLHASAELVPAPSLRNPARQWQAVLQACRQALQGRPLRAVHLHGLLPYLIGNYAVRSTHCEAPTIYSPHGSRSLGNARGIRALARFAVGLTLQPSRRAAIVNLPQEPGEFKAWSRAELVESPVAELFLGLRREEATQPSIVTAGRVRGVHEAELISQLAVLLGAEEPHIDFTWLGAADPGSRVRLQAAGVQVLDLPGDASCAAHLASGWIFLAPGRVRGFPLFVAQAMAAGLPCVAFDCPAHRAVIRDGQTGFLCTSAQDMIDRIALLVDDLDLRERLGAAARQEARRRFSESEFGTKLLAAYSQPA